MFTRAANICEEHCVQTQKTHLGSPVILDSKENGYICVVGIPTLQSTSSLQTTPNDFVYISLIESQKF